MSRHPCGGGPLGQVLSRGGIPRPGGIIILVGVALGESGAGTERCCVSESLLRRQTTLPESPAGSLGPPACPQYQCR